jgi:phosphatidylserine decarboxylase
VNEANIHNRWPVAKEGLRFILPTGLGAVLLLSFGPLWLGLLGALLCLFITFFFRDPKRLPEAPMGAVLAPADGRIIKVEHITANDSPLGEPATKISIFMTVFNVHVNRIPVGGTVEGIDYHKGAFFSANLDKASEQNERNTITLTSPQGRTVVFIQIAGLIARRIVCWIGRGDQVEAGQRFGLVRFGSRLDVYLPQDSRIVARMRDRVKAGETVIAHLA